MVARHRRRFAAVLVASLAALVLAAAPVSAGGPVGHPHGTTVKVVAEGLDNPRGLAFGPDGALYVAEAGTGGDILCINGPEGEACFGLSGAITRITPWSQRRVVTGLPSGAAPDGSSAGGPTDITFGAFGRAYVPINLGADPADRASLPASLNAVGWLVRANVRTGAWSRWADVSAYERQANPDGGEFDSNPYSAAASPWGVAVADAGANAVLLVKHNRHVSTLAVFPDTMVDAPPFLGLPPGTKIPMQAVPNSVVRGPDGAWYVGQLTGFPFPSGAASVFRVVPGHAPTVFATGFTNVIDLAFAQDGSLLVLEIAANGLLSNDLTGRLVRVSRHGTQRTILMDGLVAPGGLAVGRDGAAYVSNFGIFPGTGQVLKVRW